MEKIKRCKSCNDVLPFTNGDFGLVDYLCYVCWTKREELKGKHHIKEE